MPAPVWVLSVDLQTKTAMFTSGMGDAARSARTSFDEIKRGASEMGRDVGDAARGTTYSMTEARHGVILLGEEFGVHLPRGITSFIASLGPVGAAMEAAFPYLAIVLGVTLLIEHITKIGEAEEKAAEAGHKLTDSMAEGINKADQEMVKAEIEIRKLAEAPAWDLLAKKMQLQDAEKGLQNVSRLQTAITDLLKAAPATSNWNPLNWTDNSGDTTNKAKALQEQMRGKSESDQAEIAQNALTIQSKILQQMQGQTDVSEAELKNQQRYVDFLKQETELLQAQADAAVLADQAQQGKDRADRIRKAEEEQQKIADAQQRGLDHRLKVETEYAKKASEERNKEAEVEENLADLKLRADAAFYREIARQEEQRAHSAAELGKESAEHTKRMAALDIAANEEAEMSKLSRRHISAQAVANVEMQAETERQAAQQQAYAAELAALDKYGKDYELKKKQIEDRAAEAQKASDNKIAQIENQASQQRFAQLTSAQQRMSEGFAHGFTDVLMRHQSFAAKMNSLGSEVASAMMQNAIVSAIAMDFGKEKDAAHAARKAFNWGWDHGGPAAPVLAPALGALAFAAEMAFAEGGIVPGVEKGDVVNARLTPGEAVIPKSLTDGLIRAASGNTGGNTTHIHARYAPTIHAIDATGIDRMLTKHADKFNRHFEAELRKHNY